jgi:MerR family transcriptional regulator, light-induced transcriptional regulator
MTRAQVLHTYTIAAVERETGLSKDTLRVWERRYGFPRPARTPSDARVYSHEQVERLRLIRRLLDRGHRAGAIVSASARELRAKIGASVTSDTRPKAAADESITHPLLRYIHARQFDQLRQQLALWLLRLGLERFIAEVVGPLTVMIGESWACGELHVADEHLFSEQVQTVLRDAIGLLDSCGKAPRVLLTTVPGEEHQLGLLMAHACLALQSATCIQLGAQMPLSGMVSAARTYAADAIALSFSRAMRPEAARRSLVELRAQLPGRVAIWAGGQIWARRKRGISGVSLISSLQEIPQIVSDWRMRHHSRAGARRPRRGAIG